MTSMTEHICETIDIYYNKTGKYPNVLILSKTALDKLKVELQRQTGAKTKPEITIFSGLEIVILDDAEDLLVKVGRK